MRLTAQCFGVVLWVKPCKPPRPLKEGLSVTKAPAVRVKHVCWERALVDEPAEPSGTSRELGSVNSSGWCRGPANTNMRIRTGKGSVVVVDVLNGDDAVQRVKGST